MYSYLYWQRLHLFLSTLPRPSLPTVTDHGKGAGPASPWDSTRTGEHACPDSHTKLSATTLAACSGHARDRGHVLLLLHRETWERRTTVPAGTITTTPPAHQALSTMTAREAVKGRDSFSPCIRNRCPDAGFHKKGDIYDK